MAYTVAIVGRPNVGKSTIFNRLAGERISIVEDTPGVTRDRIYAKVDWLGAQINLIDTGGLEFADAPFMEQIRLQADIAMEEADLIVMLASGRDGLVKDDERLAGYLHQTKKPVLLAINKIDNFEQRADIYDFYRLGLGEPLPVSGAHGLGLGELLEAIIKNLPQQSGSETNDATISFALIGRPNAGKSSLANAILGEERSIVSDVAGTTRDAIDSYFTRDGQAYRLIDTAGLRRKGRISDTTEKYSVMRAMDAIEKSDVCVFVLDATQAIADQDKNIAGYAQQAGKAVIILVNKWDAVEKNDNTMVTFKEKVQAHFQFIQYAPILFVSARTKQRLHLLPALIKEVYQNSKRRVASSLLNEVLARAMSINPAPSDKGRKLRVYYLTQVSIQPPTFVAFVNDKKLMHFSYERFLKNQIRESFDFSGTPINLLIRERQ